MWQHSYKTAAYSCCCNTTTNFASSRCQMDHRLDPVKLPTFDGKQENWLMFKDVFESMVHNRTELDDTYKLSRLRQCVDAQAVPMVGGVYTGGYEQLWAELKRRYDNPRRLVESHVNRLLDLPDHPALTQRNIRNVIDVVRSTLRAINVLGLATDQWVAVVYLIVLRKLPTSAATHWTVLYHSDTLPQLQKMLEEIETCADTLRMSSTAPLRHSAANRSVQSHVMTPKSSTANMRSTCPRCSESHRLFKCPQFRALSLDQRLQMVRYRFALIAWDQVTQSGIVPRAIATIASRNTTHCFVRASERAPTNTSTVLQSSSGAGTTAQVLPRIDAVQSLLAHSEGIVLLATAKALVVDSVGEEVECRVLCDMGSQVSFITESFFKTIQTHCGGYRFTELHYIVWTDDFDYAFLS
ncbi:uncharacterized protein [Eurosta solidaginis]|uniref:uncharacterized protein n=1 Tax=Eurosta solidaginis TaxID=178769 RepID=UPI003530954D